MYGTAELFADFEGALPGEFRAERVGYPNDRFLSFAELLELVRSRVPSSEPYVIVAESYSTPLAIQFAATNPPNLKGVVLSAGFATSPVRGLLQVITPFAAPVLAHLPISGVAAWISAPRAAATSKALQDRVRTITASIGPKVLMDRARAAVACDVLEELSRIRVPMLYLQSRHDRVVSAACLEDIRRVKPEIEIVVLDGPHLLLQVLPQQAAEIVAEFVRRLR
jgi:pimeloyl-[acyl-carrier protein] methyl ester esterase